jgi:nuclease-like protein
VTFSNRGAVATPTPASGGDESGPESGSADAVRLIWPGGNGAGAAPGVAEVPEAAAPEAEVREAAASEAAGATRRGEAAQAAEEAADPDDLPFWDWSADQSDFDDPSDALAPDRPEDPDGPDYPDYRAPASADPPLVALAPEERSRRPRRSDRDRDRDRDRELRRPGQVVVTPVEVEADQPRREGIGQHLGSLAHLAGDPRRRVWLWRAVVAVVILVGLSIVNLWLLGLTLAVLVVIADTIVRSRRVFAGPAAVRQAAARRSTRKQLAALERAGYRALHDIAIPGTEDQIDHMVIGPAGVFAIDSEAWDKRLPIRTRNGRQLWHGPFSMKDRLEHARWESERAATRLSGALGSPVTVRPAMAIYGPKVHWDVATIRDVDVFSGPRLRKYLRRMARHKDTRLLSDGDVEKIDKAAHTAFPQATVG